MHGAGQVWAVDLGSGRLQLDQVVGLAGAGIGAVYLRGLGQDYRVGQLAA